MACEEYLMTFDYLYSSNRSGRWGDDPHTRKGRERKKAPATAQRRKGIEKEFINSFSTNFLRVETLTLPHPTPADPHEKKKKKKPNTN
jgi:hypothetical protein